MYVQRTSMSERNPFIIPEDAQPVRRGCPSCGENDYSGRMAQGYAVFKCRKCGNEWHGGIGAVAADPREPMPPQDPKTKPIIDWALTKESGVVPVPVMTRRPDPTPDFRKGAPVPSPGDEDV